MKIILFADRLPPLIGGMETHAHYFAQYFKSRYDLYIVSRLEGKDVLVDDEYRYIRHITLAGFLSQFKKEKIVLFFNSGRWIEELCNIRDILPHSIMIYRTGGNEIIQSPLTIDMPIYEERKAYWRNAINYSIDYLITNSEFTDKRLLEFGIKPSILRHIAGGVDADTIYQAVEKRKKTRAKYGVAADDFLCVSCARFVSYKRPDFLICALAKCKKNITLLLAGDGPLEDEIKFIAKKQRYPIRFLGNLSQKDSVELIAAADVYAQSSTDLEKAVLGGSYIHTEGMGRSLLEAVCSGVPVVVTDCGAVGENISSENGRLVNTEEEMALAIDYYAKNGFKTNSLEKYMNLYSFDRIFEGYVSLWK